jgi:hypothetical protein
VGLKPGIMKLVPRILLGGIGIPLRMSCSLMLRRSAILTFSVVGGTSSILGNE